MQLSISYFGLDVVRDYGSYELLSCPFHSDTHPSAIYTKSSGKFVCLGCGVTAKNNTELANMLGSTLNLSIFSEEVFPSKLPNLVIEPFIVPLKSVGIENSFEGLDYVTKQRHINLDIAKLYGLRWCESEKGIVFEMGENSKVIRLVNSSSERYKVYGERGILWPKDQLVKNPDYLFVSEGPFKAMSIYQGLMEGTFFKNGETIASVATMGSFFTKKLQYTLSQFNGKKIIFIGDNDKIGVEFTKKIKENILGVRCFIPEVPFDELVRNKEKRILVLYNILEKSL